MQFDERTVELSACDPTDETYRITTHTDAADLAASLHADGLIHAPIVTVKGNKLIIVSGFRRFAAAKILSFTKIDVRLVACRNKLACARLAILENSLQRPLNMIEVSRALNLLTSVCKDTGQLSLQAASLGLPANPAITDKLKKLCRLPQIFQSGILNDLISLSMALELSSLKPNDGESLMMLFAGLQVGLNLQRELLTHIREITSRDQISIGKLLHHATVTRIMADETIDRPQRLQQLRSWLYDLRYPAVAHAESEFRRNLGLLKLAKGVRLIPPKNFESSRYTFRLPFTNITEFKHALNQMNQLASDPVFRKMIT